MSSYTNIYAQKIYEILVPLIGDMMTKGTLKSQAAKLGINEESIAPVHLPALAEELRRGLVAFLGSDAAKAVASKIMSIR
ncbi:MAG TPA: hypothetical protein PK252_03750 [Bacteroidales bacterium]|nr:hypothetical protein [Bacteroidales bacterium]